MRLPDEKIKITPLYGTELVKIDRLHKLEEENKRLKTEIKKLKQKARGNENYN